jgi:hypothetical protein
MKNDTEMPTIQFGEGNTYDMLGILTGLSVRLWFEDTEAILVCTVKSIGFSEFGGETKDAMMVLGWSTTAGDYVTPLVVEIDKIRKIEVM